jgi:DNA-binding LacI/PurR family transcriptional regulator
MVGIRALARHLDLSTSTVSRALNNNGEVSPETRRRVLAAASQLGYSPNQSGRSLRQGRLGTVGLMLPAKGEGENYTWSLFLTLAEGIQTALARHDLDLVIYQNSSRDDEFARLKRIVERQQADGIILAGTLKQDRRLDYVSTSRFPFVAFGRSDSGGEHPWLDLDFEQGARLAIDRLVGQGHRRMAIGLPGDDSMQGHVHLAGYRQALVRHGIAPEEALVCVDELTERGGYHITERLLALPQPPTAILFQSDCMAIGAYRKLSEMGLRAGRDIAISGGVLTGAISNYLYPRLTGYSVALNDLGERMGETLLASMPGFAAQYPGPLVQQLWPLELQVRNSDTLTVG